MQGEGRAGRPPLGEVLPLVLGAITLIALWASYPHAYSTSDPAAYAENASWVQHGQFAALAKSNPVFQLRFGVFLPVALIYSVFGATPYTTDLLPLLAVLTVLFVVWSESSGRARWFAVFCVVTCQPLVAGMLMLYPDIVVTAWLALSVFALSRRLTPGSPREHVLRALFGVLAWFGAMLTKESAWWALPLWLGALMVDLARGRRELWKWFYAPAVLAGLGLCVLYLWFNAHFYGDALIRIHNVQALAGKHTWRIRSDTRLVWRLTAGAIDFFWRRYGMLPIVALCGLPALPANRRIWGFYALVTTLLFWFGSTSLTSYQPMPLMPRMNLPSVPGLCLCAGFGLAWLSNHLLRALDPRHGFVLTSLFATALLLPPLTDEVQSWHAQDDSDAMAVIRRELGEHPSLRYLLICSEPRGTHFVEMSLGFEPPENLTVVYAGDLKRDHLASSDVALLLVDPRHQVRGRYRNYRRVFAAMNLPAVFRLGRVTVFMTRDLDRLRPLVGPRG